jgi:hypothetical protein
VNDRYPPDRMQQHLIWAHGFNPEFVARLIGAGRFRAG